MKFIKLLPLLAICLLTYSITQAQAWDKGLKITFDASFGEFANMAGSETCFMHTGIAPDWCEGWLGFINPYGEIPLEKQEFTNIGEDLWEIAIPKIGSYYAFGYSTTGQPMALYDTNSETNTISMIFRNLAGNKLGKSDPSDLCWEDNGMVGNIFINIIGDQPVSSFGGVTAVFYEDTNTTSIQSPLLAEDILVGPNPFLESTTLQINLLEAGSAQLAIYEMSGKLIYLEQNIDVQKGINEVIWNGSSTDGSQLPAGSYFYHFSLNGKVVTGQLAKQ